MFYSQRVRMSVGQIYRVQFARSLIIPCYTRIPTQTTEFREVHQTVPREFQSGFTGLSCSCNNVLLWNAIIRVLNLHGDYQNVRVLLDSDSQVSAITL